MSREEFQIAEDDGNWHIRGILPTDDRQAAKLLNIMYDCTRGKVGDDRHLNVVVENPALELAITPDLG